MSKKRGLPEDHTLEASAEGVTEVANLGDFLDEFEPAVRPRPAPTPELKAVESNRGGGGAAAAAPAPARPRPAPATAPAREQVREPVAKQPAKKPEPTVVLAPRKRPPRKEIGLDAETLKMLGELHRDGMSQSSEESLTRSEVARAAMRAVHEARKHIDYSSCGRRGKWGTTTARALLDDLTESYIRAIGQLYMERYHREDV
ncbi:MAG: hypothetical protein H6716_27780 [Polyangiaceae bacterium]|nr:hypothetical protein [Polyangiaceae bacterium]